MSFNCIISDTVARINWATKQKRKEVIVRRSKLVISMLHFLYEQGFISSFTFKGAEPFKILVNLKYFRNTPTIKGIKILSTPGKKNYLGMREFAKLYKGAFSGTVIFGVQTSKGFLTQHQCSLQNCGGEILFKIW